MKTGQILWITWCSLWAIFWITLGWFLPGLNLGMFLLSLVLMIPALVAQR